MRHYLIQPKQTKNEHYSVEAKGLEFLTTREFYEIYNPAKLELIGDKADKKTERNL